MNHFNGMLGEKEGDKPGVEDAEAGKEDAEDKGSEKPAPKKPDQKKPAPKAPAGDEGEEQPEEKPIEDDPADKELDAETSGEEEKDTQKRLGDELVGQTIQSVTTNPKSKMIPGALEIIVSFDQTPDPLKILVTKTGTVKYFYRTLHNEI